jgi:hemerythrin superfamily protein
VNAVQLLKKQHRQVKKLFHEAESAASAAARQKIALEVCDQLAVHATIEEKIFYPEAMAEKTEDQLREAVEEHLGAKRVIADLMASQAADPQYLAKIVVLKELIEHHVEEEEESLFPRIEKLLGDERLKEMGARMETMANHLLSKGEPRDAVPEETQLPAPLPRLSPARKAKRTGAHARLAGADLASRG